MMRKKIMKGEGKIILKSGNKIEDYIRKLEDPVKNPGQVVSYKKHVSTMWTTFENIMKETLQPVLVVDEMKLFQY